MGKLAELALQPEISSLQAGLRAIESLSQTDDSVEGCIALYNEVVKIMELPVFEDNFRERYFRYKLLSSSNYGKAVSPLVDIKKDSIETIQERLLQQQAISGPATEVNAVHNNKHRWGHTGNSS